MLNKALKHGVSFSPFPFFPVVVHVCHKILIPWSSRVLKCLHLHSEHTYILKPPVKLFVLRCFLTPLECTVFRSCMFSVKALYQRIWSFFWNVSVVCTFPILTSCMHVFDSHLKCLSGGDFSNFFLFPICLMLVIRKEKRAFFKSRLP